MDSLEITKFFEDAAHRLGIPADRLATLVNGYEDWSTDDWTKIYDETGIEIAEISSLHALLVSLFVKTTPQ